MSSRFTLIPFGLAAVLFLVTHCRWLPGLPDQVATHFDGSGNANGWMNRSEHGFGMAVMGLGVPALLVGLCALMRWLPPSLINMPNAAYWRSPEQYPTACQIMNVWARTLASMVLVWFTLLNREIVLANRSTPPALHAGAMGVLTLGFVTLIGISIGVLFWRFRKLPSSDVGRL